MHPQGQEDRFVGVLRMKGGEREEAEQREEADGVHEEERIGGLRGRLSLVATLLQGFRPGISKFGQRAPAVATFNRTLWTGCADLDGVARSREAALRQECRCSVAQFSDSGQYTTIQQDLSDHNAVWASLDLRGPSPDVLQWASSQVEAGREAITKTAATASDPNAVEYHFANTTITDQTHDSGWQSSPLYQDSGLDAATSYSYTVRARDKSSNSFQETGCLIPVDSIPGRRSELEMSFLLEGLHDFQGREGVIGGVEELPQAEIGGRPIAGGDGFGFWKAELEQGAHGPPDADLPPVAEFTKNLIEIEFMVERDAQSAPDLAAIIFQPEAHLQDMLGSDDLGGHLLAWSPVQLEDEGFVGEGQLNDMWAAAFLANSEGRFGFGVKSRNPCRTNFVRCGFALGLCLGHMNVVRGESGEGGQERRLCFGGSHRSGAGLDLVPIVRAGGRGGRRGSAASASAGFGLGCELRHLGLSAGYLGEIRVHKQPPRFPLLEGGADNVLVVGDGVEGDEEPDAPDEGVGDGALFGDEGEGGHGGFGVVWSIRQGPSPPRGSSPVPPGRSRASALRGGEGRGLLGLLEEPFVDGLVGIDLVGDAVVAVGEFGVFGFGAFLFEGLDHGAALLNGNSGVFGAVEDPDGDLLEGSGGGGVAASGDGDAGGEEFGLLGEEVEGAVAAHGVAGEVDALFVDGKILHEFLDDFHDVVGLGSIPTVFVGALGGDDEAGALAVVVVVAEGTGLSGGVGGHDIAAAAVEVDDERVAGILGAAEFAIAEDAVFEVVAFGAFPFAGEEFGEFPVVFGVVFVGWSFLFPLFDPSLVLLGEFGEVEGEGAAVALAEDGDLAILGADVFGGDGLFAVGGFPLPHFGEGGGEAEKGEEEQPAFHDRECWLAARRGANR